MNTTNLTCQVLLASALVIAVSGEASAQTTKDVTSREGAMTSFFAAIATAPVPYYVGINYLVVGTTPPRGQFMANQHVCVNWMLTQGGKQFVSIELSGGGNVYAVYSTENFIPDPANTPKCAEAHQKYIQEWSKQLIEKSRQDSAQSTSTHQPTGDAGAAKSSPTSAQSASPEQPPSEANQAKANVGGTGTDAGALEAGLAAEKRGDWKAAFLLLEPLAKQGNADAQAQIGFMYETGRGVWHGRVVNGVAFPDRFDVQDGTVALVWYRKAADQGNAQAQVRLGRFVKRWCGKSPAVCPAAMEWFRKAADQGYAEGQFQLGLMYYEGKGGIPQDFAEAMKWFRKAADQGDSNGQVNVGVMYENGQGIPQDDAEAIKWYRKAADQGNADAQEKFMHLDKDNIMKPKLAARKEIGDSVCYPSACTYSSCVIYGQVEKVHDDKIEVRVHVQENGTWISTGLFSGTTIPGQAHDQLNWISYNEVIECH